MKWFDRSLFRLRILLLPVSHSQGGLNLAWPGLARLFGAVSTIAGGWSPSGRTKRLLKVKRHASFSSHRFSQPCIANWPGGGSLFQPILMLLIIVNFYASSDVRSHSQDWFFFFSPPLSRKTFWYFPRIHFPLLLHTVFRKWQLWKTESKFQ